MLDYKARIRDVYYEKLDSSIQEEVATTVKHALYEFQGELKNVVLSNHAYDRQAQGRVYNEEAVQEILEGGYSILKVQFHFNDNENKNYETTVAIQSNVTTTVVLPSGKTLSGNMVIILPLIPHKDNIITFYTPNVDQF